MGMIQDARYALRQLRKSPGFTITAVMTLALGIGANAAIFTLVHAVLLRNLPVVNPAQLVRIGDTDDCCVEGGIPENNDYSIHPYELYTELRDHTPEFEQMAAMQAGFGQGGLTVRSAKPGDLPKSLSGEFVSGNYFQTFGLQALAGRLMVPSDDKPGASPVAVMSFQTWQREYGQDASVIGSTFMINTVPTTVIGVTPPSFYGDRLRSDPPDFFVPFSSEPLLTDSPLLHRRNLSWVYILGRVKPGTELAPLQARMSGAVRQYWATIDLYQSPATKVELAKAHVVLTPGDIGIGNMQQEAGKGLKMLMTISALVLLIACANIANLVLVRGLARRAETSIRVALGAQRSRLIRQMLTESIVLALLGGVAGLVVAYAGTRGLLAMAFPDSPALPIDATPSLVVLGFAFVLSLVTGVIFGLAPAWITSHAQPADALRSSSRTTKDSSSLLQRGLVVIQAALSVVLLVFAGLMSRTLGNLENRSFGLETENRVVIHINPEAAGYKPTQLQALYEQIQNRFQSMPGVQRVGVSLYSPLEGNNWGEGVFLEGRPEPGPNDPIGASWLRVSPDFFATIGQPVLRGRGITAQDTATSRGVVVVNQAFVRKFFKNGGEPLGKHFGVNGMKSTTDFEIVGVVADAWYNNTREPVRAMYFRPLLQMAKSGLDVSGETRSLYASSIMLQLKGQVPGLEAQARQALASINSSLTVVRFETFASQIHGQFGSERMIARLTLLFGVLALALASLGLYGVTAYMVAKRTPEIGIRMALGAGRGKVVAMVMRDALLQAAIGLGIGIPVALFSVRYVKSMLYGVAEQDVLVLVTATLVLAASACIAGLIPARRAASTDPAKALRTE